MRPALGSQVEFNATVDPRDDGLAEASRHVSGPGRRGRKALTALAVECTEALRHFLSHDDGTGSIGVRQESRVAQEVEAKDTTDLETSSWPQPTSVIRPGTPDVPAHVAAVQAEAARVAAKVVLDSKHVQ